MARHFDAIAIGSGLGGLTAAALYARGGRRVLVLERSDICGGAATVYRHGSLAIEASLHEIDGLDDDDPKVPSSDFPHRGQLICCEVSLSDRQTKQLVITGRTSKAEWTRDDTARAVAQGSGLFTAKGSKVMRVQRIDGEPGLRHQSQSTLGFRQ